MYKTNSENVYVNEKLTMHFLFLQTIYNVPRNVRHYCLENYFSINNLASLDSPRVIVDYLLDGYGHDDIKMYGKVYC